MKIDSEMSQQGFTLIEVMVAIAILVIGILSLYTMQVTAVDGNMRANMISEAGNLNAEQIELLIGLDYAEITDTDGDGTDQDPNHDGIDDDGDNFGLDDRTTATADGTGTSADGLYRFFWNAALDTPIPNVMTIHVHVQTVGQAMETPVTFIYYKVDII
ncbi:MAG: prepilin-type N-terminal cleavage/methylation domain-containing protein [Desulfopila sp.]